MNSLTDTSVKIGGGGMILVLAQQLNLTVHVVTLELLLGVEIIWQVGNMVCKLSL